MRKNLLAIFGILYLAFDGYSQWNPDPAENNLVVGVSEKGNSIVSGMVTASDGAGGIYIGWIDGRNSATTGNDIFLTRVLATGLIAPGFPAGGLVVCNAPGGQSNLDMVDDGEGGVILAWQDNRDPANSGDIFAQRVNGLGAVLWTANGKGIATTTENETQPSLVRISNNRVAIVYRSVVNNIDLFSHVVQIADGNTLGSRLVIADATNNQSAQHVSADGQGGFLVAYTDGQVANNQASIRVQRIDGNNQAQWAAPGILVGFEAGSNRISPQVVGDGEGGAVVCWADLRPTGGNTGQDIYAQRLNALGEIQWQNNGLPVCQEPGNQTNNGIIKSGDQFIIWWTDPRAGATNLDLFAQSLTAGGIAVWTAGGLQIVNESGNQPSTTTANVAAIPDDGGGVTFIWDDRRDGSSNEDIFAQKVNSIGTFAWTQNGVPVATRIGSNQNSPVATASTEGAIIVAWRDSRSGNANSEIFTSRLQRDGTLPVRFLEIAAALNGKTVDVRWTSAQEQNLAHYDVERSANGLQFEFTGRVSARNRPGVHTYQLTDWKPENGANFYRIRSVDQDGSSRYSQVVKVAVTFVSENHMHLYPNPAVAQLNIQLGDKVPAGPYALRMIDAGGRVLKTHRVEKMLGQQTLSIMLNSLPAGVYRVQLINEKGEVLATEGILRH